MDPDISLVSRNRNRRPALVFARDDKDSSRDEGRAGPKKEAGAAEKIRFEDPKAKYFREIQTYYHQKKAKAFEGLAFEDKKITVKETRLRSLSPNFAGVWRTLQNKTLFFSCLRISIRNSRFFGIPTARLRSLDPRDSAEPRAPPCRLLDSGGLLFGLNSAVAFAVMLLLVLFYPLDLAFGLVEDARAFSAIAGLAYFLAALDAGSNFLKPFIDQHGTPVTGHSAIAALYLKSWLAFDALSCVPYYFILGSHQSSKFSICILVLRYLRIVFARCHGGPNLVLRKLTGLFSNSNGLVLMKTLAVTSAIIHICSCTWVIMSNLTESANWYSLK